MKNRLTILLLLSVLCLFSYAQSPSANFTAAVQSGCSPLVVDFKDLSSGNPTSYLWDFGNGATSTLANPSTTYFNAGTYTVKLTVTNANGSHTLTRDNYITIYEKPTVDFKVNDSNACYPHQAIFTDLSTPSPGTTNVAWLWDFGNGTQSTEQNPQVTYNNTGNYTVTLKVTNDKGCSRVLTKQQYVKIIGNMTAGFTNTMAATCAPPFNITFHNTSNGPGTLTYNWDFGDGNTSTQQNPTHTYTTYGNYDVKLTVTSSAGCTVNYVKQSAINVQEIKTSFTSPANVCANSPVTFQNTSTPAPVSSLWVFSDGTTSTDINAVKKFSAAGIYTLKLYNTYTYCTDSAFGTIEVLPVPAANFTTSSTINCKPPHTVNFTDASTGAVSWFWDFGDGNTSTQQSPSHTYTSYGRFDVKLIVTNSFGCTDTLPRNDLIEIVQPAISFSNIPVEGCIPYTINPIANIATLDNVTSYLWDFGNGATSTLQNPSYTYTQQGTYTVKLTITTSLGCTETYSYPSAVVVGRVPVINFSATPNPVCAFQEIQFTDLTNEGDKWEWHFGDGSTSVLQHPKHKYSDTGLMDVKLMVTNNGCQNSFEQNDFVRIKPPIASFQTATNCNTRLRFNFIDKSIGAVTWFWDFGDGKTSTDQNPTHDYTSFGIYTVSLTVTNGDCSHTTTRAINVFDESPKLTASTYNTCRVANITFTATTGNASNLVSYNWDFGQGHTDANGSSVMTTTYPLSGDYNVRLITTDLNGCKDTMDTKIKVTGPTAKYTAQNTFGCKGLTTTFTDASTDDGISKIVNWKWDFGDGTIRNFTTGSSVQHTYTSAGNFEVKLVVTDATGCRDSFLIPNTIITTAPIADFTVDTLTCPKATVNFSNTSNAINYTSVWNFGDGNSSIVASPSHSFLTQGSFNVGLTITDAYGCTDDTVKIIRSDLPDASFTVSDSISSCAPFEVVFTNTSQYYNSAYWVLNGGTSTAASPVQYYNLPGHYIAKLYVTSPGGCIDSAQKTISVYDTIGTKITYLPLNGCKPLDVDINAFSKGPMRYTWDFGDGVIVNTDASTYKHVYNSFGEFVPKAIMTDPSGCVFAVPGLDTIKIKGADVNFGYDKKLFCDSGYVSFTDSTTFNDPIVSYNWNFGDGNISAIQQPVHQFTSPGLYSVSLSVQTQSGCTDTLQLNEIIKVVQSPLIGISGDSVICVHEKLLNGGIFLRSDTSAVSWRWNFPNGNVSTLQNPPIQQYNTVGTFNITSIATNSSGCADTSIKKILINPLPIITVPSTLTMQVGFPITIPATYSSNTATYTWTPSNFLSCTDCPRPIANPKSDTRYNVAVVDSNGCKNNANVQIIVICKNGNVFVPNTFSPNGDGSNDVFYVRGRGLDRVKSLRVFNRWGEIVFEQRDFPVNNPLYGWDGKYKGNKPQADVYVYQVEVFCDNSEIIRFEGNVALIQ